MKKGLVLLHGDFSSAWEEPLKAAKIEWLGLHVNPFQATVDEFLAFVDNNRELLSRLEKSMSVDYRLHAVSHFLPRALFDGEKELFRMNEKGERTADYNGCPSSEKTLAMVESGAEKLAKRLKQKSERYHFWTDDDLGGDVRCHCAKCKHLSATEQNLIFYKAMLRGIKKYDGRAKLSFLVYGEETLDGELPEGMFIEYAPFRRRHDLPFTQGKTNAQYAKRCQSLLDGGKPDEFEVLEYFLSYDYVGFCGDNKRVASDIEYYRSLGVERLFTFVVFPEKNYVEKYGFDGIMQYASL